MGIECLHFDFRQKMLTLMVTLPEFSAQGLLTDIEFQIQNRRGVNMDNSWDTLSDE